MKKIIVIAAFMAVAACSKPAPAPEAEATTAAAEVSTAAANIAADGKSSVGTFKVTTADGKVYTEVVKADGSYESTGPDKAVETGTWEQKNPNLYCDTKTGEAQKCNEENIENGVWTSKNSEGKISKVERVG